MNAWEMPQVQALGEERLRLMQEAAEKCRGKSGMERLDIFLEYGEKLSEGRQLAPQEQEALLAAVAASLPEQEQRQLTQLMQGSIPSGSAWQDAVFVLLQLNLLGECFFSQDSPHFVDIRQCIKIFVVMIIEGTL